MIQFSLVDTRRLPSMTTNRGFVDDCVICQEVCDADSLSKRLRVYRSREQMILLEADNFLVMPDIRPLLPGHSLIVTRHHLPSLADLSGDLFDELERVYRWTVNQLRSLHGDEIRTLVSFEHGAYGGQPGSGHCVNHAHLHVLPLSRSMPSLPLTRWLTDYGEVREIARLQEIASAARASGTGYLFAETEQGQRLVTTHLDAPVPSQYMRERIGLYLGRLDWNWKAVFSQARANTETEQ